MNRKELDIKMFKTYSEINVKCKYCGHTNTIPVYLDSKYCGYCKKKIYNKGKLYFKYKMRKELENECK